ncbi:hypothetical protein B0T25DRAFT_538137, partial [Lasiosphaeria hispida]
MAGTVHEFTIREFEGLVRDQLTDIRRGNDQAAADFAWGIRATGSPKIADDDGAHHPDGSFAHEDAGVECVILEVSHSQQRHDLPFLADEYILGSNGRTQVVIGIDLEYREEKGKEARVTVWRPRYIEEDGEAVLEAAETETGVFRAVDGSLGWSPPQQLTESDEERLKAAEKRVKRQLSDEDSDYIPE